MSTFRFRAISDEGKVVELTPTFVRPYGALDVVTGNERRQPLPLEIHGIDASIDGIAVAAPGHACLRAKISFSEPATIYSLVPGGWVHMPFAIPSRFLVDRNVVINIRRIREGRAVRDSNSLQWWTRLFAQGAGLFNPLPYAMEAGFRRKPTRLEFLAAFQEGVEELQNAFPSCKVVEYDEHAFAAAYALLEEFDRRTESETSFLLQAAPLVACRVCTSERWDAARGIAELADQLGVRRDSIATLATLSCVFEDSHGKVPSIGKKVLKPSLTYTEVDAFNALSDIRHLEVAAAGHAFFGKESFAFCTCDKPLVRLWSAMNPHGEVASDGTADLTFSLTEELFYKQPEEDLKKLKALIQCDL